MKNPMRRSLAMFLGASMTLATMSACSSTNGGDNAVGGATGQDASTLSNEREFNLTGQSPITFPLDEPLELDFHYHASNKYVFNENWDVFEYMKEMTNISFVNQGSEVATKSSEQHQLQAVEGFQHDLYGGGGTNSYFMSYGPLGAFYSLDDYWDYLPNFSKFCSENPDVVAAIVGSDDKIYHFPYVADGEVSRAYFIRQDWLDNLGLPMPTTVEELEATLIAFRDDDPNGNGINDEIPYFNDYWEEMVRLVNLWDSRCYASDSWMNRIILDENTNEFYHAWMTDEFKTGIENVSRWYDMGLIDPEIFTKGTASRVEYLPGDIGGMTYEWVASTSSYNGTVQTEGFDFVVMAPPLTEGGNQWSEHARAKVRPEGWGISTNCDPEDAKALFTYMDYFWSEEGRNLTNFGVEGVHWTMTDDGPKFTELVTNNPENKAVNTYLQENVGSQLRYGYWQNYDYEIQWTHEKGVEGVKMYIENDYCDLFILPELNYTDDELAIYNSLRTDIDTFLEAKIQEFVLGNWEDIDGKWDSYITQLESIGVDELIDLTDGAYTRFMSYFG